MVVGLIGGYLASDFFLDPPPDQPKPVAQLIRELHEQDTVLDKVWLALWLRIPSVAKKHLTRFEPKPAAAVRWEACQALGHLRTEAAKVIPALISAVNDSYPEVQRTAIQALGEMGPLALAAQPELIRIFKNHANQPPSRKGEIVCADVAVALAMISPEDPLVFNLLKEALVEKPTSGSVSAVTIAAVSGLEKMAGAKPEVASTLISALSDADANLKASILSTLGRIRQQPETVVPILIEALDANDEQVRRAAVMALGNFGLAAAPAVPKLIRFVREEVASRKSKPRIGSDQPSRSDTLTDEERVRYGLMAPDDLSLPVTRILGRIGRGAQAAIPFLIEEYSNPANSLRYEEAFVRWQIDGNTAAVTPVFLEGIRQPAFRNRSAVFGHLIEMGLESVPILLTAFHDPDGNVRMAATESLVKIKPTLLLDPALLQSGINDPHLSVRLAVIQALGACGPEAIEAVPLLKPLLDDPKYVIRKVTAEAFKNIQPARLSP